MKLRSLAVAAFSLALASAVPAAAQSRSDFNGTWAAGARVMSISASDSAFSIQMPQRSFSLTVGAATRVGRNNSTALARWSGATMNIEVRAGRRTYTRVFELLDQNTLRMTSARGGDSKVVEFTRQ